MNFDDIRDNLPNMRSLLPILLIVMILLGNILFFGKMVLPRWMTYQDLVSQVDAGKSTLADVDAERASDTTDIVLQHQIDSIQEQVDQAAVPFVTGDQADQLFSNLFAYASDSGVDITNLQAQQASQEADSSAYDVRGFRLQVEGDPNQLMRFVTSVKEAAAPSVVISELSLDSKAGDGVMIMGVQVYTSPLASGSALDNLPVVTIPEVATPEPAVPVISAPAPEPTADPASGGTTYLAAPPPLSLLYVDSFDAGVLYAWDTGVGWTFVNSDGGQALQITRGQAPMTFLHKTLRDAAIQVRFQLDNAGLRMSLRESDAGNYTATLSANGRDIRLNRGDVVIQTATLPTALDAGWHSMRLMAVDDLISVVVDDVEYISLRDLAALPPGAVSFALVGDGTLRVDDFMLWTPHYGTVSATATPDCATSTDAGCDTQTG